MAAAAAALAVCERVRRLAAAPGAQSEFTLCESFARLPRIAACGFAGWRESRCEAASGLKRQATTEPTMHDPFHARDTFETGAGPVGIYRLSKLEDAGLTRLAALPYSIRVLLESRAAQLRRLPGHARTTCAIWPAGSRSGRRRSRSRSSPPASSSRTSPACRRWSIWRPCGAR